MNGLCNNRKGTTLVEILVVMLILLVGIMTVIQMFPSGFRVVRAAENQTIATKLAQAEVERWKNMPGNLPDGILPLVPFSTGLASVVDSSMSPGPPFEGFTGTASPFKAGNVVNFRKVENELATIPTASYFTTGSGSVYGARYTLAFSPIEFPANGNIDDWLTIKSGDLQRRVGESDSLIYLRRGQYGIDYDRGNGSVFHVCFSYDHDVSHEYALTYSYLVVDDDTGDEQLLTVTNAAINPSSDGDWVEVEIPPPPTGYSLEDIEEGTDSCARKFTSVSSWSGDPYEFSLSDPILGIVAFNPYTKGMNEYTARGVRPITARISYRIYDPRIIREDRVVPALNEDPTDSGANTHSSIKLALRFILNAGTPGSIFDGDPTDNPDEPTFEGLVKSQLGMTLTGAGDIVVPQSMLIIDLTTGLRVEIPPSIGGFQAIDYKAGMVHLPKFANLIDWNSDVVAGFENVELKGRHLRFFYRADGDWSVQCQKAYSYYLRKWGTDPVDYAHFKLQGPDGGPYRLLFARCDSGKSVTVDYSYVLDGSSHKVVGQSYRISDDSVNVAGDQCAYAALDVPAGATIDQRIIVVGASFRARVIWRDGKAWRFVDIDTALTRNSSP